MGFYSPATTRQLTLLHRRLFRSAELVCFANKFKKAQSSPQTFVPSSGGVNAQLGVAGLGLGFSPAPIAGSKGFGTVQELPSGTRVFRLEDKAAPPCPWAHADNHCLWLRLAASSSSAAREKHPPSGKAPGDFLQGKRDKSWRRGNKTNQHWTVTFLSFTTL